MNIWPFSQITIIPINELFWSDLDMALEWGLLSAANECRGTPVPVVDALLAETAITHNLTLVTRNDKVFAAFPPKVLNPWV